MDNPGSRTEASGYNSYQEEPENIWITQFVIKESHLTWKTGVEQEQY
jgi:hypothetical protein